MESFSLTTKTSVGVKRQRRRGSRRSRPEKCKTITWSASKSRLKHWDLPRSERPSRRLGRSRKAEQKPAELSRGVSLKGSLAPQVSTIRALLSNRRLRMGPSRRTGLRTVETGANQGLDDSRVSDQKRFRDAQSARTSGATSARRCAAPLVEAWDALLAENARSAGRTPRPAPSVAHGLVGYVNFDVFVGSGHLFIGRTVTARQLGPKSIPTWTPKGRRRFGREPKP